MMTNENAGWPTGTIVGWDSSEGAVDALEWAVDRERGHGGTVTILRVVEPHGRKQYPDLRRDLDAANLLVSAEAARVRRLAPDIGVDVNVVAGDAMEQLLLAARADRVLAVGAPAPSTTSLGHGWSLGVRLAGAAPCPVAVVPRRTTGARRGVVVGIDGSDSGMAAALFAAHEATRRGDTLRMVHAWLEPPVWTEAYAFEPEFARPFEDESRAIMAETVARITRAFPEIAIDPVTLHRPAAHALLDEARERALLVVGTRGIRGIRRLLLGSVSHSVLLEIACPTVVVGHSVRGEATTTETV